MDKNLYLRNLSEALSDVTLNTEERDLCLNYASRLLSNNLPVIFDLKHLSLLLGLTAENLSKYLYLPSEKIYKSYDIPKKNFGYRSLQIPCLQLKYIQRWILDNILYNIPLSEHSTGFNRRCSILKNARMHLGSQCVINMDLEGFFPSIKYKTIFRIFYQYGYSKKVSYILARLCTIDSALPQGSPASPYLANLACLQLDKRIHSLCQKFKANYSRYADDITISGRSNITKLLPTIESIILNEHFKINKNKTRIAFTHQHQEVTGLTINNNKITVSKKFKKDLKQTIYYCLKYGPYDHQAHINDEHAFFKEHLYGKIYFLKSIEPDLANKLIEDLNKISWDY